MPTLHFQGKFTFHMPRYDNYPENEKIEFESNPQRDEVFEICGCDPTHYFEFIFRNVIVSRVTYDDGTFAAGSVGNDSVVKQRIRLNGIMPDVSPSAVCAQLFAGNMKIGNLLAGTLQKSIQSDLRVNLRPLGSIDLWHPERAGAHFETYLDVIDKSSPPGSRFLQELGNDTKLEFYMHLNRYTYWSTRQGHVQDRLSGDVYGYIRPIMPAVDNSGLRIKSRRMLAHPDIRNTPHIVNAFVGRKYPLTRNEDIDGSYDLLKDNRLLMLRYLDFVPLLDRCNNTPTDKGIVKEYIVYFVDRQNQDDYIEIGRFQGDYSEMQNTGGVLVFPVPTNVFSKEDTLILVVKVVDKDGNIVPLMKESELDLVLESDRGLTLGSEDTANVIARVYSMNRPLSGHQVRLLVQPDSMQNEEESNTYSPIVAKWKSEGEKNIITLPSGKEALLAISGEDGKISAIVEAINLENSQELFDPVSKEYIKGELPWDRYYGNYLYLEIDNDSRIFQSPPVEKIEISSRVLHAIKRTKIPERPSFGKDLSKLFLYYLRYFPWLHARELPEVPREVPQRPDEIRIYSRFPNVESYEQISNDRILNEIIRRLRLDNNEWDKMPRSRDFPFGGRDLIERWQEQGSPK